MLSPELSMTAVYSTSPSRKGHGYCHLGYWRSHFVDVTSEGQAISSDAYFAVLEILK
jgi:hypothetical protein